MKIALVTPAGAGSRAGNRHTALRWAAFLRAAGHHVALMQEWAADAQTDLMLALHARRSHDSIRRFAEAHPGRPLVLALTGTDVYRDIHVSAQARESLRMAGRYVVLQKEAIRELPEPLRRRARVVIQSCSSRLRHAPVKKGFRIAVIGHLREEKDPLRALEALACLPRDDAFEIVQLGDSLDESLAKRAREASASGGRYRWLGGVSHARTLAWLASSHAMVISSRMEGGANVVSEAIRIGVPVLASRISGNVGLLGRDYRGYFPLADEQSLARLMQRAAGDDAFYRVLKRQLRALRPLVAPRNEARMLRAALEN